MEKISAWNLTKVRSKKEVIDEARNKGAKVHFASLMDICHLKNAELEAKHQKIQQVVLLLRGDTVKDDSGSYAVFTEQGSSASQMDSRQNHGYHLQIAWLRWTSSRRSICLYPSKNGRCSQIIENSENRNVQRFGFVYHDTNRLNHGPVWKTQSFFLKGICTVHPLAGLLWERQFEKILLKHGWEKIPNWECLFVHREIGLFLSVYVDDIKLAGKNIDPMLKVLNEEIDLGEPTSFLDHVYLGCTQRQCQLSKDIVDNYRTMFESRISAGGTEKLPFPQNLRISSWSFDMEGHAKKCVERYCELANKSTQELYKVSTPCIDDHHFKGEEMKSVGELSNTCSQIVLKCLYLARIGRPDILWSVNKLARSITKWTKACYKRLNRLISYIHHA